MPVVVDLVAEEDDLLVVAEHPGTGCAATSLRPRSITVNVASSKLGLSPSRIGVFGKTRLVGQSSPKNGPTI